MNRLPLDLPLHAPLAARNKQEAVIYSITGKPGSTAPDANTIVMWGDEFADGLDENNEAGNAYLVKTGAKLFTPKRKYLSKTSEGATSTQVLADMLAPEAAALQVCTTWIWACQNDLATGMTVTQTMANIDAMVAHLGHDRYVIFGPMTGKGDGPTTTRGLWIADLRSRLNAKYAAKVVDTDALLKQLAAFKWSPNLSDLLNGWIPQAMRYDDYQLTGYFNRYLADAAHGRTIGQIWLYAYQATDLAGTGDAISLFAGKRTGSTLSLVGDNTGGFVLHSDDGLFFGATVPTAGKFNVTIRETFAGGGSHDTTFVITIELTAPDLINDEDYPLISGPFVVGQPLTVSNGNWTGSPYSYSYEWYVLDIDWNKTVLGTLNTYIPQLADLGKLIRCGVTAYNSAGDSEYDADIALGSDGRTYSGYIVTHVGDVLVIPPRYNALDITSHPGDNIGTIQPTSWIGNDYGTLAFNPPDPRLTIQNGNNLILVQPPTQAEVWHFTIRNTYADGSTHDTLASLNAAMNPPQMNGSPTVDTGDGRTFSVVDGGEWSNGPVTLAYQWVRDFNFNIPGATGSSYTVTPNDFLHNISVKITATNQYGSGSISWYVAWVTEMIPPSYYELPTILVEGVNTSEASVGDLIYVQGEWGGWDGSPYPDLTLQWFVDGVAIPGETTENYTVQASDAGKNITLKVTGTNTSGTATLETPAINVLFVSIYSATLVLQTGDDGVGSVYAAQAVTSDGSTPSYQWQRSGVNISGATAATYTSQTADQGKILSCVITPNGGQAVTVTYWTWVLPASFILARFDSMTNFTSNTTLTPVAENDPVTGAKTLAVQQAGVSQGGYIGSKTSVGNYSTDDIGVIAQINYLRDNIEWAHTSSVETRLNIGASGYINFSSKTISNINKGRVINYYDARTVPGLVAAGKAALSTRTYLSSSGATTGLPYAGRPRVAAVVAQAECTPVYCYTYDDGNDTLHDWLLAQHEDLQIPFTFYLPRGNIGTQYCMNETKVNRMWLSSMCDIGIDGDRQDNPATNLADPATVINNLLEDVAYCQSKGWHIGKTPNSLLHLCWPNSTLRTSDSATNTIRVDANTTNGTTSVTLSAANANIKVGMTVTGYQVPANTKVVSISGTALVVDKAIPAPTKAATLPLMFRDMTLPFIGTKLLEATQAAGFLSARATIGFQVLHDRWGMDTGYFQMPAGSMSLATADTLKSYLDQTVAGKGLGISYGHIFDDTNPSGLATKTYDARAGLEYAASLRQQQKIVLATVPQAVRRGMARSMPFNLAA
jgi:hypothetical protein